MNGLAKQWSVLSIALLSFSFSIGIPTQGQSQTEMFAGIYAQSRQVNTQDLQKQAEQLVGWLGTKEYDKFRSALPTNLQSFWSPEKLQQLWEGEVLTETGSYKKILRSKVVNAINANLVFVTTQFENSTEDIIITFNENGQVVAADFPETKSIEEIAEAFVQALAAKDYAKARGYLHPLLKAEVFPQKIQRGWESLLKQTGSFKQVTETEVREGSDKDIVVMTVQFEKQTEIVIFVFDTDRQIVNVDYTEVN